MASYSTPIIIPLAFRKGEEYIGISSDMDKCTASSGDTFYAVDEDKTYYNLGGGWYLKDDVYPVQIDVTTKPTATQYAGATFSKTSMVVTATMSDDSTKAVTTDCDIPAPVLVEGDNRIVISYKEKGVLVKCVYTQTGTANDLNSISITTAPDVVAYAEGDYFNPAGVVVKATYKNGTTENIVWGDSRLTHNATAALTSSDTSVTFSVKVGETTKTANQSITVIA